MSGKQYIHWWAAWHSEIKSSQTARSASLSTASHTSSASSLSAQYRACITPTELLGYTEYVSGKGKHQVRWHWPQQGLKRVQASRIPGQLRKRPLPMHLMLALATDILGIPKFCRCCARPILPDDELAELVYETQWILTHILPLGRTVFPSAKQMPLRNDHAWPGKDRKVAPPLTRKPDKVARRWPTGSGSARTIVCAVGHSG